MKALVTGSSGLIGRSLMRLLRQTQSLEIKEFRTPLMKRDIGNSDDVKEAVDGMDVIFHLAGTLNYRHVSPNEMHRVNVEGTGYLLSASLQAGVKSIVIATTQGVYSGSKGCPGPITEDEDLLAKDAYGQSKINMELLCKSHAAWKQCKVTLLRIAAVYGPGSLDRDDVLSEYLHSAEKAGKVVVFGSGKRIRDMVWVDDVADVMTRVVGRAGVYNVGGGYPYTSREIAETVTSIVGGDVIFDETKSEPSGLWMDISRLRAIIPYNPINLRSGIMRLLKK